MAILVWIVGLLILAGIAYAIADAVFRNRTAGMGAALAVFVLWLFIGNGVSQTIAGNLPSINTPTITADRGPDTIVRPPAVPTSQTGPIVTGPQTGSTGNTGTQPGTNVQRNPSAPATGGQLPSGPAAQLRAPVGGGVCEGMHDYSALGLVELSSASGYVHLQFYRKGEDGFEMETLLPPGRYKVLIGNLDGHVWELGPNCGAKQAIDKHVGPSIQRRLALAANNQGYVHWQKLVDWGYISVIKQIDPVPAVPDNLTSTTAAAPAQGPANQQVPTSNQQAQAAPAAAPQASSAPAQAAAPEPQVVAAAPVNCDGVRLDDHLPTQGPWVFSASDKTRIINGYEQGKPENKILVPPGPTRSLRGIGGSAWEFAVGCEAVAQDNFERNRFTARDISTISGG